MMDIMDAIRLRELELTLAELLGWPKDKFHTVPCFARSPLACATLDEEMRNRGFWLILSRETDVTVPAYWKPAESGLDYLKILQNSGIGASTECEARVKAAIRALEKERDGQR